MGEDGIGAIVDSERHSTSELGAIDRRRSLSEIQHEGENNIASGLAANPADKYLVPTDVIIMEDVDKENLSSAYGTGKTTASSKTVKQSDFRGATHQHKEVLHDSTNSL